LINQNLESLPLVIVGLPLSFGPVGVAGLETSSENYHNSFLVIALEVDILNIKMPNVQNYVYFIRN